MLILFQCSQACKQALHIDVLQALHIDVLFLTRLCKCNDECLSVRLLFIHSAVATLYYWFLLRDCVSEIFQTSHDHNLQALLFHDNFVYVVPVYHSDITLAIDVVLKNIYLSICVQVSMSDILMSRSQGSGKGKTVGHICSGMFYPIKCKLYMVVRPLYACIVCR